MTTFFDDEDDYFTGPPLTQEAIGTAELHLGVRLPASYLALLAERNGGVPRLTCFPTAFPTSWASDHIGIDAILGIGGERGIDSPVGGSRYMVAEWGYPDIGVVIVDTPSGGHDTVMLDYSECGPDGEPAVVYVDEDRVPRRIAETFADFIVGFMECPPVDL
jgi:hypothetical protein